ncbi:MAG: efflux RND transporter periplasmic adaptor subunit [Candidatus Muiribacteriota bacterium]
MPKIYKLLFIVFILFYISGCENNENQVQAQHEEETTDSIKVKTKKVIPEKVELRNSFIGNAEAEYEILIKSEVEGRVSSLLVKEGEFVEQGDIIARIDDSEAELRLNQAQIKLNDALFEQKQAELNKEEKMLELKKELSQTRGEYEQNKILMEKARDELENQEKLFRINATTRENLKEAERNFEKAEIDYEITENNYKMMESLHGMEYNLREELLDLIIKKAKNNVESMKNEKKLIERELKKYTIKAPTRGLISNTFISKNHSIGLSNPEIVSVIGISDIIVRTNISESDIQKITINDEAKITFDVLGGEIFFGTVNSIKPVIDASSRTFPVGIFVDNSDNLIKPGMFARIEFPEREIKKGLWIPDSAVRKNGGTSYVFVVEENMAVRKNINTGSRLENSVEALSGLEAGDELVVEGIDRLREFTEVEVIE